MGGSLSRGKNIDNELEAAVQSGEARIVKTIVQRYLRQDHHIPIHQVLLACSRTDNLELLALLLDEVGATEPQELLKLIDMRRGEEGSTPLMLACELGDAAAAALLIDRGADLRLRDRKHGRTCLHYAILANKPHLISLLVDKEHEHHQRHYQRKDAKALFKRLSNQMRETISGQAPDESFPFIDVSTRTSFTPLMYACFFNHAECITNLMRKGAQYKIRRGDHSGSVTSDSSCLGFIPYASTALHMAACRGHYEAAWALLSAYSDSLSPVWTADGYRMNESETGRLRIDPRLINDNMRLTPFEAARRRDFFTLLPLLNPVTPISVALDDRDHRLLGPLSLKKIAASVAQAVLLDLVSSLEAQLIDKKAERINLKRSKHPPSGTKEEKKPVPQLHPLLGNALHKDADLIGRSNFQLPSPSSPQQGLDEMLNLQKSFTGMLMQQEKRLAAMMSQMLAPPPPPINPRASLNQIPEAEPDPEAVSETKGMSSDDVSGAVTPKSPAPYLSMYDNTAFEKVSQPMGSSPVHGDSLPAGSSPGKIMIESPCSKAPMLSHSELHQHIYVALMTLVSGAEGAEDEGEGEEVSGHNTGEENIEDRDQDPKQEIEEQGEEKEDERSSNNKLTVTGLDKTIAAARSHRLVHGVHGLNSSLYGLNLPLVAAPVPVAQEASSSSTPIADLGLIDRLMRPSNLTRASNKSGGSRRSSLMRQRLSMALSQPSSPSGSISNQSLKDDACGVCFDDVASLVAGFITIQPCKHKICCPCAKELIFLHPSEPIPCPFCRGLVRGFGL